MLSFIQTIFKQGIILVGVIFLLLPEIAAGAQTIDVGIIKTSKLNLRSGPSIKYSSVQVLKKGAEVVILERDKKWLKVSHGDKVGYIRNLSRYVKIVKKEKEETHIADPEIQRVKDKADEIDHQIQQHEKEVRAFSKKEIEIIDSLNDIEKSLNKSRLRAGVLRSDLKALERKIDDIEKETAALIETIRVNDSYMSKRLVSLYKLNTLGRVHVLASAESLYEVVLRKKAMETILEYDAEILKKHIEDKTNLEALIASLNQQRDQKRLLEADLNDQISIMSRKKSERKKILSDISNKKALGLAAITALKRAADELDKTIVTLQQQPVYTSHGKTGRFSSFKGLLNMPVEGKITANFGAYKNPKFNVINFRSGIEIKADRGAPIKSVGPGKVLYATWFKGYGNMIIIDHGDNYYSVYAHAEKLLKKQGDTVGAYEIIATVGDTASLSGSSLYFEVRYHGRPMDPMKWLKTG